MSKASNFSIVGFFHDRDKDPVDFVRQLINLPLANQFKVNSLFSFRLGKKNDLERKRPDNEQSLLTFNISRYRRFESGPKRYYLFRKKDFNTLYEINTVQRIIKFQNGGNYDKDFIIDWTLFRDMLVMSDRTQSGKLEVYKIFFDGIRQVPIN